MALGLDTSHSQHTIKAKNEQKNSNYLLVRGMGSRSNSGYEGRHDILNSPEGH